MDEFWGVTVLLLFVIIVMVAVVVRVTTYFRLTTSQHHERVLLSDRVGGLKSGDVLLFIRHTHGFTNSVFTLDLYSHAAMVLRGVDGELLLTEATTDTISNPETGEDKPIALESQINPLRHRLDTYPGAVFLMPLEEPLSPAQEAVLRERAAVVTPYPGLSHMVAALFRVPSHGRARHCMQHVAWLLDGMQLTPRDSAAAGGTLLETGFFRSSRVVTTLPGRPLGPGGDNAFAAPRELVNDLAAACRQAAFSRTARPASRKKEALVEAGGP